MKTNFFSVREFDKEPFSKKEWGWILAVGIVDLVLGIIAFSLPVVTTVGVTIALALLLIVAGLSHTVHAVKLKKRPGQTARFFQALLAIVTGALMLRYPQGGMLVIALALSFYFFLRAVTQWIVLSEMRPQIGWAWGWGLVGSIATFLLGVYILATFPVSAFWVPGLLVGIDLVILGSGLIGFAISSRTHVREIPIHTVGQT